MMKKKSSLHHFDIEQLRVERFEFEEITPWSPIEKVGYNYSLIVSCWDLKIIAFKRNLQGFMMQTGKAATMDLQPIFRAPRGGR
jgi:hypothetical protein